MTRFNQLIILLALICVFGCIRIAVAEEPAHCQYYGNEFKSNLSELRDVTQFERNVEISVPFVQFQYNGYSVSKKEYERLKLRDKNKHGDPGERLP